MYQLPRRIFLGLEVRRDSSSSSALLVTSVTDGSPAARAGLEPGDLLVTIDGAPLGYPADLRAGAARPGPHELRVARAGGSVTLALEPAPLPLERIEGGEVTLGALRVGAHHLRTIRTTPTGARRGAVLYLQGIDTESCENPLDPEHPLTRLVEGFTRAGFVTLRVDRSGVGDSDGPPPTETDLRAEIDAYTAAFDALAADGKVFLFGHSLGGMIAPLLERRAAGAIVFGTTARRWRDAIVDTTERQLRLAGFPEAARAERLAAWAEMQAHVLRDGLTPAEVFAKHPHLANLESRECEGETIFGRHVSFFRDLQARDLAAAWRALEAPALVLHGEHDWVCSAEDARAIAETARAATHLELPGVGHDMLAHASLEASFRWPAEGRWDGRVVEASLEWLAPLAG